MSKYLIAFCRCWSFQLWRIFMRMTCVFVILMVSLCQCVHGMEFEDPKKAESSLLNNNCTIDAKQGIIFGFPLGMKLGDFLKKAGPPAAVFNSKSCEVLFYGGEIELIFKNNELFGVNLKKTPMPDYVGEDQEIILDGESKWDVNGIKYNDSESKVLSTFNLEKLKYPPHSTHRFSTNKCNMTIVYSVTSTEDLKHITREFKVESIFIRKN